MRSKPKASRVLRSAQEALPNVLFDTLEVRYRRLRNSWKSSSGSTRRLPAYGGIVGAGVSRNNDARVKVEAFAAASAAKAASVFSRGVGIE